MEPISPHHAHMCTRGETSSSHGNISMKTISGLILLLLSSPVLARGRVVAYWPAPGLRIPDPLPPVPKRPDPVGLEYRNHEVGISITDPR